MKKQRALQEQLPITSNIRLLLNKYSSVISPGMLATLSYSSPSPSPPPSHTH